MQGRGARRRGGGSPLPFRNSRLFYGWWIVGAGVGIQALIGAFFMQSYGSYAAIFERDFGWSKTTLSLAFSMVRAESGVLGPVQGWLIDRLGPRAVMTVGLTMLGVGFMLFSRINSLPQFFAVFMFMALGQSLGGFMALTVAVVNWFDRRRAMALGILMTGFAIGGLALPLVGWALVSFGWRETAFASGVLMLLIGLPLAQLVRHRPEPYGELPDGRAPHRDGDGNDTLSTGHGDDFTAAEAMRTRSFWLISLGHASALLVVGAVMVHLVLYLTSSLGYSIVQANFVWALVAAMQVVGQLGGGFMGDRLSKRAIVVGCMAGHAAGLLLLAYASALWMVIAFGVLHGLAWGTRGPLMSAIRADYFGASSFGTIMGFSSMVIMTGMLAGPMIAGVLADRTGSYELGFTIIAVFAAVGSIFFAFASRPPPPLRATSSPEGPTAQRTAATAAAAETAALPAGDGGSSG